MDLTTWDYVHELLCRLNILASLTVQGEKSRLSNWAHKIWKNINIKGRAKRRYTLFLISLYYTQLIKSTAKSFLLRLKIWIFNHKQFLVTAEQLKIPFFVNCHLTLYNTVIQRPGFQFPLFQCLILMVITAENGDPESQVSKSKEVQLWWSVSQSQSLENMSKVHWTSFIQIRDVNPPSCKGFRT